MWDVHSRCCWCFPEEKRAAQKGAEPESERDSDSSSSSSVGKGAPFWAAGEAAEGIVAQSIFGVPPLSFSFGLIAEVNRGTALEQNG